MKRKDPLKILTNQTKANVSFLMMSSPNGTISSNVALNRRKTTEVIIYTLLIRMQKLRYYIMKTMLLLRKNYAFSTQKQPFESLTFVTC